MGTENTRRYERGTLKWWEEIGETFALKDKVSFRSDGVVVIKNPEFRRMLDCKYVWVERVRSEGGGLKKPKKYWLPKMLSSEWLVVVHGKPGYKTGWESIRPETYDRKPPEDEEGGI